MISTSQILQTEAQAAAIISIKTPRSEMVEVFGPAAAELMAALAAQDVVPDGAVFAHHVKMSPDFFEFELGVKIAAPFAATGRVQLGQLPAARVARTIYSGPYEGLSSAWGEVSDWMAAKGHKPAGKLWEIYPAGPHSTPDPTGWRTEMVRLLVES